MSIRRQHALAERRKVLVVDDDEGLRSALVECLCAAGIAAFHACDGLDALGMIRRGCPPCALLLDIDMPRLNGPQLVEELRTDDALAGIPVVTMSAGNTPVGLKTIGHLAKPFDIGAMLALLFQACRSCARCDGDGPVIGSIFEARRRADQRAR